MQQKQYKDMFEHEKNHWWFRGKRSYIRALLQSVSLSGARILDIGSGTGYTTKSLEQFGRVDAIEHNKQARMYAKRNGVRVIKGNANALPFRARTFDCITILDVLYHKKIDADKALKEACRVVKKYGWLLITDCAHASLYGTHDDVMHARLRFEKKELERAVQNAGFTIVRSSYLFTSTFPIFVLSRIFFRNKKLDSYVSNQHWFINIVLSLCIHFESLLLPFFNLPYGSSIIVLAKKT